MAEVGDVLPCQLPRTRQVFERRARQTLDIERRRVAVAGFTCGFGAYCCLLASAYIALPWSSLWVAMAAGVTFASCRH